MSETEVSLPWTLRYPITIVKLQARSGEQIDKHAPLFSYSYVTTLKETRDLEEEVDVEKTIISVFEAPVEGIAGEWRVQAGDVISAAGTVVVSVFEPCTHAVQYAGMCALCGKDLTFQDYSGYQDVSRASINMFHNSTGLTVSLEEAQRIEKNSALQLLAARKLILVVDLDQTVIHTTVDPTVGEWKKDPSNPNYDAVKDVATFSLDEPPSPNGYWYYVKLRPGLTEFLENVSQLYELHIYTMATKTYARAVSRIIDPTGKFFGDRILSRDESGNLEQKNLQRLFPVDTSLVCVIDDRGDVWKWSDNLIKVIPYEFFVGIGDINSSFLPKRQQFGSVTGNTVLPDTPMLNSSTLDNLIELGGGETNPELLAQQKKRQNELIESEKHDRPLARQQSMLEQLTSSTEENSSNFNSNVDSASNELVVVTLGGNSADGEKKISNEEHIGTSENKIIEFATKLQGLSGVSENKQVLSIDESNLHNSSDGVGQLQDDDDDDSDLDLDNITISDTSDDSSHNNDEKSLESALELPKRNTLLVDHDDQLINIGQILANVHNCYYSRYQPKSKNTVPTNKRKRTPVDWKSGVPDIKTIMPQMKRDVLGDVTLVFSGTIPLGVKIDTVDIVQWARSFGAKVVEEISAEVTHVIAERYGTRKIHQAKEYKHIKIVRPIWLYKCLSSWVRVPEDQYELTQ
ncbi:hypothetical protein V1514DRAFT_324554 [Lipomyces japonicus]|uniref:uncharacterized protein n=1 Tax=Lipomyces japonicus TaxID=56871 RepID=UPI0034CECEFC